MSVPTLMNMAPAPAIPPPLALIAAFLRVSLRGSWAFSAGCGQTHTHTIAGAAPSAHRLFPDVFAAARDSAQLRTEYATMHRCTWCIVDRPSSTMIDAKWSAAQVRGK